jgi:hypothetical protein
MGQVNTWEQVMASQERLAPDKHTWNTETPMKPDAEGWCSVSVWGGRCLGNPQLINNNLICPGTGSGARWMQGGTRQPSCSVATRQRTPTPKE